MYYHIEDNMLFVHAGYNVYTGVQKSCKHDLVWDRTIIKKAQTQKLLKYKKVFIGHTTTQIYGMDEPIKYNNLWMVDCGAGWSGKLCIMDIDTEEHWLSKRQTPALD